MSKPNDNKNQFFQKLLQDYLNTESELRMLNEAMKKRREKKKNLSESILTFIKKNNIRKVNLDGDFKGHELAEKISKTSSISKDEMMSIFQNHFENDDQYEKFEQIQEEIKQKTKVKESSKLSLNKTKMNKKERQVVDDQRINDLIENELNDESLPNYLNHLN
jgi:hypothetical protein